jgi:nitrogen regulatory protein PII-like uncharacterized protein
MNTYRISGRYRIWDSEKDPENAFMCVVVSENTEQAIQACKHVYRDAVIISTLLRDEGVVIAPPMEKL